MNFKKIFVLFTVCCILCSCSGNGETADDRFQNEPAEIISSQKETDAEAEISKAETSDRLTLMYAYDEQEKCLTVDFKNTGEASEMPHNSEAAEILRIDAPANSSLDVFSLKNLENVRQIYINGTVNDLSFVGNYKNLTDVCVEHFDGKLTVPYEEASVKKVIIANSRIEIESIDKWGELEELDISNSDVIVFGKYGGFSKLKRFNAVCSSFERNDLSFAESAPELTEFVYSPLKNIDLQNYTKLAFCNELKVLTLSGNITELDFLAELKKLEALTVITENYLELSPLYENNSLTAAAISCTGYDSEEKEALIERFPQCSWTIEAYDKIF